jgi:hypothetical protein
MQIQENFSQLEKIKELKSDEIVFLLDLFNGSLSLNEILNQDISLLNSLKKSKIKMNNDMKNRK